MWSQLLRRVRLPWIRIPPLHSSLRDRVRCWPLKKKKETKLEWSPISTIINTWPILFHLWCENCRMLTEPQNPNASPPGLPCPSTLAPTAGKRHKASRAGPWPEEMSNLVGNQRTWTTFKTETDYSKPARLTSHWWVMAVSGAYWDDVMRRALHLCGTLPKFICQSNTRKNHQGPGWDPRTARKHQWESWWNPKKVHSLFSNTASMLIS